MLTLTHKDFAIKVDLLCKYFKPKKSKPMNNNTIKWIIIPLLIYLIIPSTHLHAQSAISDEITSATKTSFTLGLDAGYDLPFFSMPYNELKYNGGLYLGGHADLRFPFNLGIRTSFAHIRTTPEILIADDVYYSVKDIALTTKNTNKLKRKFLGLGPSYYWGGKRVSVLVAALGGYSWFSGGDALAESPNPLPSGNIDVHLLNTGFETGTWSAKGDMDFIFSITNNFSVKIGLYYLRHFGVHFDNSLDINNEGIKPIAHGENVYDNAFGPYSRTASPPLIITQGIEKPACKDLVSSGINLGLRYTFGRKKKTTPPVEEVGCNSCCPNDKHKVMATVRDQASRKVIPGADVAIKDMTGSIVATGTTNTFGVVDFGAIPHNNYTVEGNVYGIATTIDNISESEFTPDAVIQKEVLYSDLRFILKGNVVNRNTGQAEPNVLVSLTHDQTRSVQQDNSDGDGAFVFRLDKNSNYEVVGKKANRLSDIERASTIGLTRSTTLFVDLELGVDNFNCGVGTVLDIKYELDKDRLTPGAKFELDRLIRYMQDHQGARVELSSHTDSRGSNRYNQDLSDRRANSAVTYIISKGIQRSRIIAAGYGETRLRNQCKDGVNCSEAEHSINRRTEAKLLCN